MPQSLSIGDGQQQEEMCRTGLHAPELPPPEPAGADAPGRPVSTVRRWWKKGMRPGTRHMMALLALAGDLGLGHLFTD